MAIAPSTSPLEEGERFTLKCMANKSLHLQNTPSLSWLDSAGNRIITGEGISVGLTVQPSDGMVMKTLTFDSLDRTHSMEYRCNATIVFSPPPYIVSKEALWDVVVECEPHSQPPHAIFSTYSEKNGEPGNEVSYL